MIQERVESMRRYFLSGATRPEERRIEALKKIKALLLRYQSQFIEAFLADYHKCEFDVLTTEFYLVLQECDYQIKHLKKNAKTRRVATGIFNFPSKGYLMQEPYGVCLIISPWNYPLQLTLEPLMGCIAAGNVALIKPASATKNVSRVIHDMFVEFGNPDYIDVAVGSREELSDLLDQHYDYIFFTGGAEAGKNVLAKASRYLTPCSLELGGKSPCIIDEDADIELAAKRTVWGKFLNAGQTCVAPDFFYVHEKVHDEYFEAVKRYIQEFYYQDGKLTDDFPYLIHERQKEKVLSLIDPNKVIVGGRLEGRCLEPTVMDGVTWEDKIMQEEIFGPVMPILTFSNLEEILELLAHKDKPLAFYYFSRDSKKAKRVLASSFYGGGCINDVIMHLTNDNLPFGGVGKSGMGSYHGLASFRTFSHQKSVLAKSKMEINVKYPPYDQKKLSFFKRFTGLK